MPAANSITSRVIDLVSDALSEIGVLATGEIPSTDDSSWVLRKLQRLIDRYNARKPMVYNVGFTQFTLKANHSPHTIGPGADFDVNQRPVSIEGITLVLTSSTPNIEFPLNKRDDAWWANERVKSLATNYPTDFYYSPDWPNGQIFFWPVPTVANAVRIETRSVLTQVTSYTQTISLPPAYWDAIVYPLAVSLCPSYEKQASQELLRLERDALKAIMVNNIASPRGTVADAGMPGIGNKGSFNYYTGSDR